jgi:alpha-methylacyl-CoA racemase
VRRSDSEPAPDEGAAPLSGLRFVEFAGIGPLPFAAMVLADLGARGIRLESPRPGFFDGDPSRDPTKRGRPGVAVDLKHPDGLAVAQRLIDQADVVVEGFRPGVMERLGLGPEPCLRRNPRLVYGRMTGWGQDGPFATRAGHDLTYLAVAGALRHIARSGQPPTPPLNLVADYGGGAMLLVTGVLAALVRAGRTGHGQVVDAAMVDGVALLMSLFHGLRARGLWSDEPGTNLLDSGAPFYDVYLTADHEYVAVAALEPPFYAELLHGLGLTAQDLPGQYETAGWPVLRQRFAAVFATRTRADWAAHFADTDACVAPVLAMHEAPGHPQLAARGTFVDLDGVIQAAPAPRFSPAPAALAADPATRPTPGLLSWGFTPTELDALRATGALPE